MRSKLSRHPSPIFNELLLKVIEQPPSESRFALVAEVLQVIQKLQANYQQEGDQATREKKALLEFKRVYKLAHQEALMKQLEQMKKYNPDRPEIQLAADLYIDDESHSDDSDDEGESEGKGSSRHLTLLVCLHNKTIL